ncbi:hypothetical protein DPMN_077786 [Dreissena polymorpha]|uniref:Uncharacterized protein n=1 Tax=Dreissena polymorpha TaxID=45954 RepID=A0A9D3YPA1_DREPO|nr:hypothetical protein DPMN_077786 [Dreissena polymorpha]
MRMRIIADYDCDYEYEDDKSYAAADNAAAVVFAFDVYDFDDPEDEKGTYNDNHVVVVFSDIDVTFGGVDVDEDYINNKQQFAVLKRIK